MAYEIYGHGNCPRILPISNYDMAKAHYEGVVPIRGRTPEVKPLGKERRYRWYQIKKNTVANQAENTEYYTYACNLYGTDCVTFYPNGDVTLSTGGWTTFTTGAMINFVLYNLGSVISESGKWYFKNKLGEAFRWEGRELKLKLVDGHLVLKGEPVQETKKFINRKAMNAMRRKYQSIIDYGKTMLAIDNTFERLELENSKLGLKSLNLIPQYNWLSPNVKENRTRIFKLMDEQIQSGDLELLYDIARYVATSAGSYSYRGDKFICYTQNFTKLFDEMIKHEFRDEVFRAEPVEIGTIFNDKNKKYFN